ncbi:MAG: type VI secretion lipoprotein TssJ [Gammaproteobacteria bacterium]|nr:type VI secretion lipoprotein TssJ [Gammaproteobacteria bacterium]
MAVSLGNTRSALPTLWISGLESRRNRSLIDKVVAIGITTDRGRGGGALPLLLSLLIGAQWGCVPKPVEKGVIEETPQQAVASEGSELYRPTPIYDNLPPTLWSFEEKGISIRFRADENLNAYNGQPHTLFLAIFQLDKAAKFKKIAQTRTGVEELLSDEGVDASILYSEKLSIYPGGEQVVVMDRMDQAKFIAIVAGYSDLAQSKSVRLVPIAGMEEPRTNVMELMSDPDKRAAVMKLWVTLGMSGISELEVRPE